MPADRAAADRATTQWASRPILLAMTHDTPGGLREIWNDLASGLSARGHAVRRFVLYAAGDGAATAHAAQEGWTHLAAGRPKSALGWLRILMATVRFLKAQGPCTVVAGMPLANVLLPVAVRLAGGQVHVVISHHSPADTYNRLLDRLDALTGQLASVRAVVSVSDAVGNSFAARPAGYRARQRTIRNALPDAIERRIDALVDTPRLPGRIVAIGRLAHQKNYPLLLRAMRHVPDGTLDIVGAGEDEAALRQLAADCGVADRVAFLGLMPRDEALACAARGQVFVQVSHYEGHSLALIEAARLGLPLVVSDVPVQVEGVTDAKGERCGIIVPLDDDARLGHELAGLLAHADARAGWAAKARALGLGVSNEAMVDAWEALLA